MADDSSQEKTEEASPRQLQKARERGEVSQSKDLTAAALLAVTAGAIAWQVDAAASAFEVMGRTAFEATSGDLSNRALLTAFGTAAAQAGRALLPLLAVVFAL